MAISTLIFDKAPYKNVLVLGLVLDKDGQKMSKSKGNAVDPFEALDQYGADAIRWYFYSNSAPWLPNRFHGDAVVEGQRKYMGTLWNTYAFYVLYANIDGFDPTKYTLNRNTLSVMDKWILSKLNSTVKKVDNLLENYKIYSVAISLDSIQMDINDELRGKTDAVIRNIERLVAFKCDHNLETKIRIHCVISKRNLPHIPELLLWAKSNNVNEVSCQPISIEKNHVFYHLLHLEYEDMEAVRAILHLENSLFRSTYAGSHEKLLDYYLRNEECFISNCGELCSAFIDANGNLWNCPRKLKKLPDIGVKSKVEVCKIIPQCMTCLKHLAVLE